MNCLKVAVTGAGGMFASNVIRGLQKQTSAQVIAFTSNKMRVNFSSSRVVVCGNDEIECVLHTLKPQVLLHFAFSRRFRPVAEIASSLPFSARIYQVARDSGVNRVVNISSQSVYDPINEFKNEESLIAPNGVYSMAKYASEILLDSILGGCANIYNLRFDSIAQSQRLLPAFVNQAVKDGVIRIVGGGQTFSFMDIEDAVSAVLAFLECENVPSGSYNVGVDKCRYGIMQLAEIVQKRVEDLTGKVVEVKLEESDIVLNAGISSSRFMHVTGWCPQVSITETIDKLIMGRVRNGN